MRYRDISNTRSAFVLFALLCLSGGVVGMCAQKTGTLVGSMAFVDNKSPNTLGDAANVTVELEHKGQIVLLVSNDHGDYVKELTTGTYCLKSAQTAEHKPLRFSPDQDKCFNVKARKDTRFDVMLLKP